MKSITVIGRRWFERINGNTYHSAEIIIDGTFVHKIQFAYGYEDQYIQSASEFLEEEGHIKLEKYNNSGFEMLWSYCKKHNIKYYATVTDVRRRKDL